MLFSHMIGVETIYEADKFTTSKRTTSMTILKTSIDRSKNIGPHTGLRTTKEELMVNMGVEPTALALLAPRSNQLS